MNAVTVMTADEEGADRGPALAVVIPGTRVCYGILNERIDAYLAAGVPLVWVLDPHRRTVTAYRPGGADPELFGTGRELTADPVLPGFRVPVAALFG